MNAVTGSKRGPVHGRPLHKLLSSKSGGCLGSNVPCLPITALIREAAPKGLRRLTAFRIFGFLETFLNELNAHTHTHIHTTHTHTHARKHARTHTHTHAHARTHTHTPHERERERENSISNSKTLFYKDCSLGSVKNLSNN